MSFYEVIKKYQSFDFETEFSKVTENKIISILDKEFINEIDFLYLLSPIAKNFLENIAKKAYLTTRKHFGKAIQLFSPLYISNFCENNCSYCGYRKDSDILRKKLSFEEIETEAKEIYKSGIRQILVLTGESRVVSPFEYILESVKILKKYFPMIGIEVYALHDFEYKLLNEAGVNYLTIYQETYLSDYYKKYHSIGPKKDYNFRIDAPERAAKGNFVGIGLGVLGGLTPIEQDVFYLGLHGKYILENYSEIEVSFSIPRLRPTHGGFEYYKIVDDKTFVQMLLALRLYIQRCGITVSTRETNELRNNLLPLCVTKVSAGVKTSVGGYSSCNSDNTEQFEISDSRSVAEMYNDLIKKGFDPTFKDWF